MLESLKEINTDYILFFLEDYILTKDIKVDVLEQLMNVILNENVDFLMWSLNSICCILNTSSYKGIIKNCAAGE